MAVADILSRIPGLWRSVRMPLLTNTAIALGLLLLNFLFDARSTGRELLSYAAYYLVFSHVIGGLASLTIPRLAIRIWNMPAWRMWPLFCFTLTSISAPVAAAHVGESPFPALALRSPPAHG